MRSAAGIKSVENDSDMCLHPAADLGFGPLFFSSAYSAGSHLQGYLPAHGSTICRRPQAQSGHPACSNPSCGHGKAQLPCAADTLRYRAHPCDCARERQEGRQAAEEARHAEIETLGWRLPTPYTRITGRDHREESRFPLPLFAPDISVSFAV